ncbi:MAG: hypothetical protein ACK4N5_27655, partial [Myxococcales bacterium]
MKKSFTPESTTHHRSAVQLPAGAEQTPALLHASGETQLPQVPPQPSSPHCRPKQLGMHSGTQKPSSPHTTPSSQLP